MAQFGLPSIRAPIGNYGKLPIESVDAIARKSLVQSPGIEVGTDEGSVLSRGASDPTSIVWAARWEHDKGPELLLELLNDLRANSIDFSISVVGQQYHRQPEAFEQIHELFSEQIVHWGFVSRAVYDQILIDADIFLSTANHEFFGLSFVEAVANGCCPVVPNGMAYPGIMKPVDGSEKLLYETPKQAAKIIESIWRAPDDFRPIAAGLAKHFSNTYSWPVRACEMDDRIEELIV